MTPSQVRSKHQGYCARFCPQHVHALGLCTIEALGQEGICPYTEVEIARAMRQEQARMRRTDKNREERVR